MMDADMCEQKRCEIVTIPREVVDRLQLAADGSDLTQEEIAQKYLQYGKKHHENAVYGDN